MEQSTLRSIPVVVCVFTLICPFPSLTTAHDIGGLYPYGDGQLDQTLPSGNDVSSLAVSLSTPLHFYNVSYETLHVNSNGVISLNLPMAEPMTHNYFNGFPLPQDWFQSDISREDILIAPFWADVDTTFDRGHIYYRQSKNSAILNRVSSDVQELFPLHADYSATWAFVATWSNVSFFDHDTQSSIDPRNTFQAVITTDGSKSFAFYRYETIEWTAGTLLGNDPETGITAIPALQAVVGFNKGDGNEGYQLNTPDNVTKLPAGLYAFQIDDDIVPSTVILTTPKSSSTGAASATPPYMNMTTTPQPSDPEEGSANIGLIIILVLVGVVIISVLVFCIYKRRQDRKRTTAKDQNVGYTAVKPDGDGKVYNPTTEEIA